MESVKEELARNTVKYCLQQISRTCIEQTIKLDSIKDNDSEWQLAVQECVDLIREYTREMKSAIIVEQDQLSIPFGSTKTQDIQNKAYDDFLEYTRQQELRRTFNEGDELDFT